MFGNECEPCQHCQQCKQRIARRYLHLWWYYLVLLLNCDHGEKVTYYVLPPALKFDCNVIPQQMCLSSKAGMRRRDATRGTFLVKHLSRGFLRVHSVYPVKAVFAMFTVCNLHCVQFALCVWTPTQHFSPAAHPSHWPLSNCFVDNPPSSHCPLQSVSFVERMTSTQNQITLRCCTQQYLCLVLAMACL